MEIREILFKGKRKDNGEWVEGHLHKMDGYGTGYTEYGIQVQDISTSRPWSVIVIPETVGQFTGLYDKNGKRIFEGDIVKHYYDRKFPESYSKGYIFWYKEYLRWKRTSENVNCCIANDCIYEVIGNIHDNPELLESEDTE